MILPDTSVWIDHLRGGNAVLEALLDDRQVICHPFIIGEIAMGSLQDRQATLDIFRRLPPAEEASHEEAMRLIETEQLFSLGIGYVDVHLLASTRLTRDARFWTRDRRLFDAAIRLGVAWSPH